MPCSSTRCPAPPPKPRRSTPGRGSRPGWRPAAASAPATGSACPGPAAPRQPPQRRCRRGRWCPPSAWPRPGPSPRPRRTRRAARGRSGTRGRRTAAGPRGCGRARRPPQRTAPGAARGRGTRGPEGPTQRGSRDLAGGGGGGGSGTRPWGLALLACGGAYWPLALEPSAMTSRHPYCCGHPPALGGGGIQNAPSAQVGGGGVRVGVGWVACVDGRLLKRLRRLGRIQLRMKNMEKKVALRSAGHVNHRPVPVGLGGGGSGTQKSKVWCP